MQIQAPAGMMFEFFVIVFTPKGSPKSSLSILLENKICQNKFL